MLDECKGGGELGPYTQRNALSESYYSPSEWGWVPSVSVYDLISQYKFNRSVTLDGGLASPPTSTEQPASDDLLSMELCPFC